MNRKGSFGDLFYIVLILTLTAFVFVTGWVAMSKVNEELQSGNKLSPTGARIMQASTNNYVGHLDGIFMTLLVVMYLGALILAFNIDAHPIFFIISLIVFGVLVLICAVFGNVYWEFANSAGIIEYASAFIVIPFVMNNFVATFVVLGFGLMGVMYAKIR